MALVDFGDRITKIYLNLTANEGYTPVHLVYVDDLAYGLEAKVTESLPATTF